MTNKDDQQVSIDSSVMIIAFVQMFESHCYMTSGISFPVLLCYYLHGHLKIIYNIITTWDNSAARWPAGDFIIYPSVNRL